MSRSHRFAVTSPLYSAELNASQPASCARAWTILDLSVDWRPGARSCHSRFTLQTRGAARRLGVSRSLRRLHLYQRVTVSAPPPPLSVPPSLNRVSCVLEASPLTMYLLSDSLRLSSFCLPVSYRPRVTRGRDSNRQQKYRHATKSQVNSEDIH